MKIKVCTWKMCSERFSSYIIDRLKNDKDRFNLDTLEIEESLCMWECKKWPNVVIDWEKHNSCSPTKVSDILFKKIKNNNANN